MYKTPFTIYLLSKVFVIARSEATKQSLCIVILLAFLANTFGPIPMAQADEFRLPIPGVMVSLSQPLEPSILKGIKVHPNNPFHFEFILDKGDNFSKHMSFPNVLVGDPQQEQLKKEANKLIKYFLASLTIPEDDLWVNLSPYEKDRIIPHSFGQTDMGRDLLAEDYMLKQITASLIYPEGETGRKFWKRIYEEAAKKYGTTNIPVNTFNKVWIIPEKAVVYENAKVGTAYIVESKLKVMLEQDYLALSKNNNSLPLVGRVRAGGDVNALGSQIVREIVIPELTKEVNNDKNFAQLRQIYNSLILATWYKKKIRDSILEQVYADKKKVAGVGYDQSVISSKAVTTQRSKPNDVEKIYQRYLQAFKKGAFNYIKEDMDSVTQEIIPRKYFSGGMSVRIRNLAYAPESFVPQSLAQAEVVDTDVSIFSSDSQGRSEKPPLDDHFSRTLAQLKANQNSGWVLRALSGPEENQAATEGLRKRISLFWALIKIGSAKRNGPIVLSDSVGQSKLIGIARKLEGETVIDMHVDSPSAIDDESRKERMREINKLFSRLVYQEEMKDLHDKGYSRIVADTPNTFILASLKRKGFQYVNIPLFDALLAAVNYRDGVKTKGYPPYDLMGVKRLVLTIPNKSDGMMKASQPHRLLKKEIKVLLKWEPKGAKRFVSRQARNDERIRGEIIQIETALAQARGPKITKKQLKEKADQVIEALNKKVFEFYGEEVHVLNGTGPKAQIIGRIDRNIAEHYNYMHESAIIIFLTPKGKVLLQVRNKKKADNHLGVYGGNFGVGQTAVSAALRELKEETQLKSLDHRPVFVGYTSGKKKRNAVFAVVRTSRMKKEMKASLAKMESGFVISRETMTKAQHKAALFKLQYEKNDGSGEVRGPPYEFTFQEIFDSKTAFDRNLGRMNSFLRVPETYQGKTRKVRIFLSRVTTSILAGKRQVIREKIKETAKRLVRNEAKRMSDQAMKTKAIPDELPKTRGINVKGDRAYFKVSEGRNELWRQDILRSGDQIALTLQGTLDYETRAQVFGEQVKKVTSLSGISLKKFSYEPEIIMGILNLYFHLFPKSRQAVDSMEDMMLQDVLIEHYGFGPAKATIKPNAWFRVLSLEERESLGTDKLYEIYFENQVSERRFKLRDGHKDYLIVEAKNEKSRGVYFNMPNVPLIVRDNDKFEAALAACPVMDLAMKGEGVVNVTHVVKFSETVGSIIFGLTGVHAESFNSPDFRRINPWFDHLPPVGRSFEFRMNEAGWFTEKIFTLPIPMSFADIEDVIYDGGYGGEHGDRAAALSLDLKTQYGLNNKISAGTKVLLGLSWNELNQLNNRNAQLAKSLTDEASTSRTGGIDFRPANMNVQTSVMDSRFRGNDNMAKGDESGIKFHLDAAMLVRLQNASGFVPVIINVKPLVNLRKFLGICV